MTVPAAPQCQAAGASARLEGRGLHTGQPCSVEFSYAEGPVCLEAGGERAPISELVPARTDRGVQVRTADGRLTVESVEHLMGALAGLGLYRDVVARIAGPEVPLLGGGALELARAAQSLGFRSSCLPWRVVRSGEIRYGEARYAFETGDELALTVVVDFRRRGLGVQQARWDGRAETFIRDIAPARTFGFLCERATLLAAGRAAGAEPGAVLVFDEDGQALPIGAPPAESELARHKLLDLLGDFFLCGGPPLGKVLAWRPGHWSNTRVLPRAVARGLVARSHADAA
ncbi:MAG: UDP-3-O-acyl-N-acetylglucosamine deacetylase [Polyangiaceae bacterium]|nr:UDP-3-O-acyl-N-acetylglucosamine deacetylase [Polyangiaceae bacterium]